MTDETNTGSNNPVESQGVPVENDDDAGTDEPEGAEGTAPDDQAARLAEGSPTPESITTAPADQVEGEGAAPAPEVQPEAQPVRHEGVVPGTEPDKE